MFAPNYLRAEMVRHGFTIEQLATEANLGHSTLKQILGKQGNPRVKTLEAIAKALNVSERLFFIDDSH